MRRLPLHRGNADERGACALPSLPALSRTLTEGTQGRMTIHARDSPVFTYLKGRLPPMQMHVTRAKAHRYT